MGQSTWGVIMRAFIFAGLIALAAAKGVPKSKFTALARGGGKIVGGEDASYGEFPHQIMLLRGGPDGSLMCGGSLVSSNMVVTAGHCCDGQSANRLGVAVGSHKLHNMDSDQENIQVSKVILHEDYDSFNILNDICLLELESAATHGLPCCHHWIPQGRSRVRRGNHVHRHRLGHHLRGWKPRQHPPEGRSARCV